MRSLQQFKDDLAYSIYRMTKAEALAKHVCISCRRTPTFSTPEGIKEYPISGLCEPCWDTLFDEGEENKNAL
jgi:hypothetical protein